MSRTMSRTQSREITMELLFGMSLSKDTAVEALETFVDNYEKNIEELDLEYIKAILDGVEEYKGEIDALIDANLQNWKFERVSKVNISILRLAIYEMKYVEDVPSKVAINEALDITRKYSDEKAVAFVNGVLDKILKDL